MKILLGLFKQHGFHATNDLRLFNHYAMDTIFGRLLHLNLNFQGQSSVKMELVQHFLGTVKEETITSSHSLERTGQLCAPCFDSISPIRKKLNLVLTLSSLFFGMNGSSVSLVCTAYFPSGRKAQLCGSREPERTTA
jgi:hypothetical protein